MSKKVVTNVQTFGRFDILGFLDDSLDSGGSGDEGNKQPNNKQKGEKGKASGGGQQQGAGAKKKSKKKKKQQAENAELRNMAFTKIATVPGGRARTTSNSNSSTDVSSVPATLNIGGSPGRAGKRPEQWEQWKVQDKGFVSNQYQTDLQKAILQSKLEFEQEKLFFEEAGIKHQPAAHNKAPPSSPPKHPQTYLPQQPPGHSNKLPQHHQTPSIYQKMDQLEDFDTMIDEPEPIPHPENGGPATVLSRKEKKKHAQGKQKAHPISLQEFQTGVSGGPGGENGVDSSHKKSPGISDVDKHFFEKIDEDVATILSKDQIKKSRKQNEKFVAEHARRVQYEDELEKKDKVVGGLTDVIDKLKAELTQVKKRNKQLCFILAQGEMKDKAEVLKQVEELTSDKDDLTAEVAELHGSLEQERSKVHSLKTELQKLQDRKK